MKRSNVFLSRAASVFEGLALAIVGLLMGFACANPSQADSLRVDAAESADAAPAILAANPDFRDPQWRGTVLLATPLPNGGHVGVIINRPTPLKLGQLFPGHAPSQKVLDPVHYGGPVLVNTLVAVARSADVPGRGSLALTPDLVLVTEVAAIDRIIEQAPASARYYLGFVLWRPGELRAELDKALWSVHDASTETVFRTDMEQLWRELSLTTRARRVGAQLPSHVAWAPSAR